VTRTRRDYYEVLGVPRSAAAEDLKKAYRRRALEVHPDRNPGDPHAEERFKELTEAYAVLGDPGRRARYDAGGFDAVSGAPGFDPSIFEGIFGGQGFSSLDDLFEQFFGGGAPGARGAGPRRGDDLRYALEIPLEEAAAGTEVKLRLPRAESCPKCEGSGAAPGGLVHCATCHGRGSVVARVGFVQFAQGCPACGGRGRTVRKRCAECGGDGRISTERTVRVRIPAGVDDKTRVRVAGEGDGGYLGGPPGDLFVDIRVQPHASFSRDGVDIHATLTVGFADLVLGGSFEVPTLHGPETVEIAPRTAPGTPLVLRGRGVPRLGRGGRGDHIVHVTARPPQAMEPRERELWQELRALESERRAAAAESGEPADRNLFERVKDFLGGER
jgi:molecular chaperone DnaJ